MTIRTTKKTVTFKRPFVLVGFNALLPAGAYVVETDEELLEGISFPAYRRKLDLIRRPAKSGNPKRRHEVIAHALGDFTRLSDHANDCS